MNTHIPSPPQSLRQAWVALLGLSSVFLFDPETGRPEAMVGGNLLQGFNRIGYLQKMCVWIQRGINGFCYQEGPYTKEYIEGLLKRLAEATRTKLIVLTGVYFDDTALGAATYDVTSGEIRYILGEKISGSYHGTGDVFGSALIGALMNEKSLDVLKQYDILPWKTPKEVIDKTSIVIPKVEITKLN